LRNRNLFSIALELSKVRITIAVSFTTITGFILASQEINSEVILPTLGIFLLACSSSVLNHLQEYKYDSLMERTKSRPLVTGEVSKSFALTLAVSEGIVGSLLLFMSSGTIALILGLTALIWYNLIYTYLKRVTANAVIPGSVIGAIPPLVGWVAAGGSIADPRSWYMALYFFVWQIPHFYLLLLKYHEQYKQAGYPVLTDLLSKKQISALILTWIIITVAIATGFYKITLVQSLTGIILLIIGGVLVILVFVLAAFKKELVNKSGKYFMRLNYYVLLVIFTLILDQFIR
jgi:protoheme IX farnesyltransferase